MHHQRVAFASGFAVFCKLTGPDQTNKMKRLDTVGSNSGVCAGQVPQLWGSTNPWQNISIDDPRWSWGGASSDGWSVASYQRCISVCVPQGEHYWSCPELCGRILPCRVAALPIFQGQRAGWRSRTRRPNWPNRDQGHWHCDSLYCTLTVPQWAFLQGPPIHCNWDNRLRQLKQLFFGLSILYRLDYTDTVPWHLHDPEVGPHTGLCQSRVNHPPPSLGSQGLVRTGRWIFEETIGQQSGICRGLVGHQSDSMPVVEAASSGLKAASSGLKLFIKLQKLFLKLPEKVHFYIQVSNPAVFGSSLTRTNSHVTDPLRTETPGAPGFARMVGFLRSPKMRWRSTFSASTSTNAPASHHGLTAHYWRS